MTNADLGRIINSEEVQSVVRPINKEVKRKKLVKLKSEMVGLGLFELKLYIYKYKTA